MSANYRVSAYNTRRDNAFIRLIGMFVCIGAAVSVAIVILFMIKLDIYFSSGQLFYFVLIDIGMVAFAFVLFLSNICNANNIARFLSFALAGLMLFLNLFVASYLDATDEFLGGGSFGVVTSSGAVEYSVVAQRASGIELPSKTEMRAGIQSTDPFKSAVERETKKLAFASFTEFENVSEMIGATEDKKLDIAVVQSAMLDAFAEYFPESFGNLDIVATFKAGTDAAAVTSNPKVDITKPFSIYVSGLDTTGDINQTARSDSNMLILINPEQYRVLLISTPRDYYVQLHGTKGYPDKLTHGGIYGIDMLEETLQDLYDFTIDYHVQINFTTITTFVESMGGIVVDNPQTFELWGQTYKEGEIWLNGDQALLFARARKGLAEGDIDRGKNQMIVIEGIVKRLTTPDVVVHYKKLISNLSGTFLSNIPPNVITQLFSRQISLGGDWSIEKMNATGSFAQKPTYSMGSEALSVVVPDQMSVYEIQQAIREFMRGN